MERKREQRLDRRRRRKRVERGGGRGQALLSFDNISTDHCARA